MSKFGDQYILDKGRSGHERLRVISEIHDGGTRELLQRAGLAPAIGTPSSAVASVT
jgi:hypothetical protein